MSDDRLAQARAEAERRWPVANGDDPIDLEAHFAQAVFAQGVEWADANPRPCTITLSQSEAILEAGRAGRYEDHEAALRAAGIEVRDE